MITHQQYLDALNTIDKYKLQIVTQVEDATKRIVVLSENSPLYDFKLSVRARSALSVAAKLYTPIVFMPIKNFKHLTKRDLFMVNNIGKKTVMEIEHAFNLIGMTLQNK